MLKKIIGQCKKHAEKFPKLTFCQNWLRFLAFYDDMLITGITVLTDRLIEVAVICTSLKKSQSKIMFY